MNNIDCVTQEKSKCFGCRACANICPRKAIVMKQDEEGFFYPVIDEKKCINCGLCKKVCPALNKSKLFEGNTENPECYAVMANDDLRAVSSSGGAFSLIANEIFKRGGVVAGVAYVGQKVQHIIIDNPDDLYKLRGSKYVQSDTNTIYSQIKDILKTGRWVLFTGTPCQCAGLNTFLGEIYDNLITVDLICHGVPPQRVFDKYIEETLTDKSKGDFYHTSFRDKKAGWGAYKTTTTTTKSFKYYGGPATTDSYLTAFIKNMCLRPSCGKCPFTSKHRQSDITIGDFWAIERYKPELNDNKGTSMVLIHNKKGAALFDSIKDQFQTVESVPIEYASWYNISLYTPLKQHTNRKAFFRLLNSGKSLREAVNYCDKNANDVAIFNLWPFKNYGGVLEAYALQQSIEKLGFSSVLINWQYQSWREEYAGSFVEDFANKHLNFTRPFYNYYDLFNNTAEFADTFIVGSDCVWSPIWFKDSLNFLSFVKSCKKKISFAPSFANADYDCPDHLLLSNKYYLSQFDRVSVREDCGVKILKEKFDIDATQVLDPTLLLSADDYDKIIDKDADNNLKDYIFNYVIHSDQQKFKQICDKLKNRTNVISYNQFSEDNKSVSDWLNLIKNSKIILTNSFHACCFAIIYQIPFWVLKPESTDFSRMESLMRVLGLENRIIYDVDKIQDMDLFKPIDWEKVNAILDKEKKRSLKWLKDAMEAPKDLSKINPTDVVIRSLNNRICCLESSLREDMRNALHFKKIYVQYIKYRILKNFVFGAKRKKYRQKQKKLHEKIRSAKKIIK